MNRFIISGRLTADPDVRRTTEGTAVARFNFAVGRRFKRDGDPDADFFKCVVFGKQAEAIEKCNVRKGTKLLIEGEMRNNNYIDKDGVKHYSDQVLISNFEFCESKSAASSSSSSGSGNYDDGFMDIPECVNDPGLPFN